FAKSPPAPQPQPSPARPSPPVGASGTRESRCFGIPAPRPRCPAPRAAYRSLDTEFALVTSPKKEGPLGPLSRSTLLPRKPSPLGHHGSVFWRRTSLGGLRPLPPCFVRRMDFPKFSADHRISPRRLLGLGLLLLAGLGRERCH